MTRSERMQPIRELAAARERDAGGALAEARRALADCEAQLAQLRGYLAEYAARGTAGTLDPVALQNRHAFLGRLGDAIRQQDERVAAARAELERRTADWQARRVESASLDRAVGRMVADERRESDRREQREADERTLQRRRED